MTWQPIETAPKDGTEILACTEGFPESHRIVHWYSDAGCWWDHDGLFDYPDDPWLTHWMPLPEPPPLPEPSK